MIDGSEKRNRQLAFELQNSHVCEKRSRKSVPLFLINRCCHFLSGSNLKALFWLVIR